MDETIKVNDTLTVTAQTVCGPCVWIERDGAGLVKIWPNEVKALIEALCVASGVLASAVAARVVTTGPAGDGDRERAREAGCSTRAARKATGRKIVHNI